MASRRQVEQLAEELQIAKGYALKIIRHREMVDFIRTASSLSDLKDSLLYIMNCIDPEAPR